MTKRICVRMSHYPLHLDDGEWEPRLHHALPDGPCQYERQTRVASKNGPKPVPPGEAIRDLETRALTLARTIATMQHELWCIHADLAVLRKERSA